MPRNKSSVEDRIYQLKITLKHIRPPIWRRLQVPGDVTLGELHRFLQVAMGWWDSHLHLFRIGRTEYTRPYPEEDWFEENTSKDEEEVMLGQVVRSEKTRVAYVYDYGDHWEHDIVVEKILPREGEVTYPICLAGRRATIPLRWPSLSDSYSFRCVPPRDAATRVAVGRQAVLCTECGRLLYVVWTR